MSFNPQNYEKILNFVDIQSKIKEFQEKKVKIIAVTKNKPIEIIEKSIKYGLRVFGENRVQEAEEKYTQLKNLYPEIELHMIGPLQTNKVKKAIKLFDYFHTLDREKLANEFSKKLHKANLTKNFFIQVNIGNEKQKSGIEPTKADSFIRYCQEDLKLNIIGLMCIPPAAKKPEPFFNNLKKIAFQNNLKFLSMGMSNDYKVAIKCNSTHIRVGSYVFGERN